LVFFIDLFLLVVEPQTAVGSGAARVRLTQMNTSRSLYNQTFTTGLLLYGKHTCNARAKLKTPLKINNNKTNEQQLSVKLSSIGDI
jgi:hypothetical protein